MVAPVKVVHQGGGRRRKSASLGGGGDFLARRCRATLTSLSRIRGRTRDEGVHGAAAMITSRCGVRCVVGGVQPRAGRLELLTPYMLVSTIYWRSVSRKMMHGTRPVLSFRCAERFHDQTKVFHRLLTCFKCESSYCSAMRRRPEGTKLQCSGHEFASRPYHHFTN
jgi:hypothetical protein